MKSENERKKENSVINFYPSHSIVDPEQIIKRKVIFEMETLSSSHYKYSAAIKNLLPFTKLNNE